MTRLIVALGNPGKKYEHTRHNAGFRVLDALARELGLKFKMGKTLESQIAKGDSIILVKPQTFMNNSGAAVSKLLSGLRSTIYDLLVVHDEVDLKFGKIRLSPPGTSAAGHNGVKSILELVPNQFSRLRIGTDGRASRAETDTEKYVLQNFTPEEEKQLKTKIIPAALAEIKNALPATSERKAVPDKPVLPYLDGYS